MGTQTLVTHICDKCNKSFDDTYFKTAKCPSEAPMMEVSIGHHQESGNQQTWFSRVGAHLGELCKYCQEDLNTYLRNTYPKYREVSFND